MYSFSIFITGKYEQCHDIAISKSDEYSARLLLSGSVGGGKVNDTHGVSLRRFNEKTFIQTDRFLYRPGEKVQFRLLTIIGNKLEVFKEEVRWVKVFSVL